MIIDISIPSESEPIQFHLSPGETLYVLGANGVGKSALIHHLHNRTATETRWISSLRRTWLQSSGSNLTPMSKVQSEENLQNWERRQDARWVDHNPDLRPNLAIFDLIQKRSTINDEISKEVRAGRMDAASVAAEENEDPLEALSELLRSANLHFNFTVDRNASIVANKLDRDPYSAAEMSDGERNALLLTAEVLTVPSGTLILVDEPELHLHRSIIEPLLNGLFSKRADCAFVISTHEVMLPFDNPTSKILLVRGCTYRNETAIAWDADLLDSHSEIGEGLKRDILGARRDIVFTEGEEWNIDKSLYARILPDVTVIAKGSRRSVENAVKGIRGSQNLHWLNAYGIVDGDGLGETEEEELKESHIYSIDSYAVESLYYDPVVQRGVAERQCAVTGDVPQKRLDRAKASALSAVDSHEYRLSELIAKRTLREAILRHLPTPDTPFPEGATSLNLDSSRILVNARQEFRDAIDGKDLATIIRRYPIKETPVPDRIAKGLGLKDTKDYEKAVRKLLDEDTSVLNHVRGLLGGLPNAIGLK